MAEHPNAALVRRGYKAFTKGDMDTLREIMASDVVHRVPGDNLTSGDHKGIDAVLQFYGQLYELTGGTMKVELEQVFAADDQVVAVHRSTAKRGRKTLDARGALIFHIVGGKVIEIQELEANQAVADKFFS